MTTAGPWRLCYRCGLSVLEGTHDPLTGRFDPNSVEVTEAEIDAANARRTDYVAADRERVRYALALGRHIGTR